MKGKGQTITITFSNRIESNDRNENLGGGNKAGYSISELQTIERRFVAAGLTCELIKLHENVQDIEEVLRAELAEAAVLVVRNAVDRLGRRELPSDDSLIPVVLPSEELLAELVELDWDKKGKSRQHKKVVNKKARYNLTFSEQGRKPNYEVGEGRVVAWSELPLLNLVRSNLPYWFGPKSDQMFGEGNQYYDVKRTGILFHGDNWRKIVIGLRIGETFPLHFQWYHWCKPIGKRFSIDLNNGDMYVMSEKAVGTDWLTQRIPTLRHAAGFPEYLKLDKQ